MSSPSSAIARNRPGRRLLVLVLVIAVAIVGGLAVWVRVRAAADDTTPGTALVELEVDGLQRSYLLDLPVDGRADVAHPLLILLHGGGGAAANLDKQTANLPAMAVAAGYVVARPDGINKQWNDGRDVGSDADDLAFMAALVEDVGARVRIDRARIYAAGISNGAFMSARLACEPGSGVAAIAQIAGTIGVDADDACDPDGPVSVLAILGRDDPIVPYAGGPVRLPWDRSAAGRGIVLGADAYVDRWIARNGATSVAPGAAIAHDATSAVATAPDGTEVALVTVAGGGHGWPGGPQYLGKVVIGRVTDSFSASKLILDFFDRH